jgi:uncharacterized protein YjcR
MILRSSMIQYIKSYNLKELAVIYGEDPRTIKNWLQPHVEAIGRKKGQKYTPKQVQIIFDKIGLPKIITDQEQQL